MAQRRQSKSKRHQEPYPAEKARQGKIILRTRTQRVIFIAGMAVLVIIVALARLRLRW